MRFDLHIHTCYSYDSLLSLESLADTVRRKALDGIAVLDHDEIDGALLLRERAPFRVIVGEEIGTLHGCISGLFIKDRVPQHLTAEETIAGIHHQAGLVLIPHPLARGVPGRIRESKLHEIIDQVDVIEGYNARSPFAADDARARELARQHGVPVSAGSDAHFAFEVGRGWTELDDFGTPQEFLKSLRRARLRWRAKTPYMVAALTVAMIAPLTAWRLLRQLFDKA